ncbi:LpqB family beta-propeller domain-containing protein [Kitasatospora sp. NPDC002227]|uniref:LpqB family beta-propeller domain-containing protein n=1 Tax=Kitasatospora sp. NPDC002227 TaxID=3154773 RepID=UPI003325FC27
MARTSRKADRRLLLAAWTGLVTLLASGCAAMPSDGAPQAVNLPQNAGAENLQVRVFPVEPHPGADPGDVLTGFLTASNADEPDFGTALKYLTQGARDRWKPDAGVVVLDHTVTSPVHTPEPADVTEDYTVLGNQVARLDDKHTYRDSVPAVSYPQSFTLVKETEGRDKGEWRISKLPDGLIIDLTNFKNGYRQVHRYFYAAPDSSGPDQNRPLVPDPIYVRRRIDPLTAAAQALLDGPSKWLAPAVETYFHGVGLVGPVSVNDSQAAAVRVNIADFNAQSGLCVKMADQLFYTLADQLKRQLDRLTLSGARGSCTVDSSEAQKHAPGMLAGSAAADPYYLLDNGQLMQPQADGGGKQVPGPLGKALAPAAAPAVLAVRRDGQVAAVVNSDRTKLAVTALDRDAKPGTPVVTSHDGGSARDRGLSTPSWDGRQNLWVIDRDPAARRVLMVRDRTVVPVTVNGLGGKLPTELRISSDGTRLALLTEDGSGAPSLLLGLVVHGGTAEDPELTVTGLRPLAPQLTDILSFSWADTDQLLVLGKERDKLRQLYYVGTDGSQSSDALQSGGDSMSSVSATEAAGGTDTPPAVLGTSSTKQIYRLVGGQWQELITQGQGRLFTYPG